MAGSSRVLGDDLFGSGALPVPITKQAEVGASAAPEFFAVSSSSPSNSNNSSFFAVTPMGSSVTAPGVPKKAVADAPQDLFAAAGKRSMLDNDILNRHATDAVLDGLLDAAPAVRPPAPAGRDLLLDNDVLSGRSRSR